MTEPPAGWYPDPWTPGALRWWNGSTWTPDTAAAQAALPASEPARSPGVDTNTVWIWLVALLPLASSLLSLLIPWGALFDVEGALDDPTTIYRAQLAFFLSPQLWSVGLAGYVVVGFAVYFSYLDHRRLRQLGIQKPFPWAFAFLGVVYPVGRSVVVRRRTGGGLAPLWATIVVYVVGQVIVAVEVGIMIDSMIGAMRDLWEYLSNVIETS